MSVADFDTKMSKKKPSVPLDNDSIIDGPNTKGRKNTEKISQINKIEKPIQT